MAGGARERRPRSSASDAQKARAVTIVTRTGGDTGERWLRSRIFARDWSVTDRRAGRPNVLSQFAPIADIWRTKAEVRRVPAAAILNGKICPVLDDQHRSAIRVRGQLRARADHLQTACFRRECSRETPQPRQDQVLGQRR